MRCYVLLGMNNQRVFEAVSRELEVSLREADYSMARQVLADRINELINSDFQKLASILYRIDVSESKLRALLKTSRNTDAGLIIADLLIERQEQKIKSRQNYKPDENISEDEKW